MFPSSSKENISPTTPRPYRPGCAMTLEQWQKSESNRIRALTIKKAKVSQFQDPSRSSSALPSSSYASRGAFQDPARPFGLSALPFGSSFAANANVSQFQDPGTNYLELGGIWRERNGGIAIPWFAILWTNCNSGTCLQFLRIAILDTVCTLLTS